MKVELKLHGDSYSMRYIAAGRTFVCPKPWKTQFEAIALTCDGPLKMIIPSRVIDWRHGQAPAWIVRRYDHSFPVRRTRAIKYGDQLNPMDL